MKKALLVATTIAFTLSAVCYMRLANLHNDKQIVDNNQESLQVYEPAQTQDIENIETTIDETPEVEVVEDILDPYEEEKIEAALLESGYFNDSIPLSYEEQDYLRTACDEFNVPYVLALAVIEHETDFRNIMGDNGDSYGYMQIQLKWHKDRMVRIGATDLTDPYDNFRTGCSLLGDLIAQYGIKGALSCYNSGSPSPTKYANRVIEKMNKWEQIVNE